MTPRSAGAGQHPPPSRPVPPRPNPPQPHDRVDAHLRRVEHAALVQLALGHGQLDHDQARALATSIQTAGFRR